MRLICLCLFLFLVGCTQNRNFAEPQSIQKVLEAVEKFPNWKFVGWATVCDNKGSSINFASWQLVDEKGWFVDQYLWFDRQLDAEKTDRLANYSSGGGNWEIKTDNFFTIPIYASKRKIIAEGPCTIISMKSPNTFLVVCSILEMSDVFNNGKVLNFKEPPFITDYD